MNLSDFSTARISIMILYVLFSAANLGLAFYVYKKAPNKRLNRDFAFFAGINGLWVLSNLWRSLAYDLFSVELTYAIGSLVPFSLIIFSNSLANKKFSFFSKLFLTIIAIFFFIVSFTPLIVSRVYSYGTFNFVIGTGSFFSAWSTYLFILVILTFIILVRARFRADENTKHQMEYFLLGLSLFMIWGLMTGAVMPMFGYSRVATDIDCFGTLFLTGFTSYAIIKHNAMGIKSLLFYAFVVSIIIVFIGAGLFFLMFLGSWFFTKLSVYGILLITFVCSILLVLIGQSFFKRTRDLEKAKIRLTQLLEESERNRSVAEIEKDKTLAIITNFSEGLLVLDAGNQILLINPVAQKYLNFQSGELIGQSISKLKDLPGFSELFFIWQEIKDTGARKEWIVSKDLDLEVSVTRILYEQGRSGNLIVLQNVTQGKIIERMKSNFVSLAAHQLRTPATGIKWGIESILAGGVGRITKKQRELLVSIHEKNERMLTLADSLLNVNRIEGGKYLFDLKPTNIEKVINLVLAELRDKATIKNIRIVLVAPEGTVPPLILDKEKIQTTLEVVIDNAIKYTLPGGEIKVSLIMTENTVEVMVSDNGQGIPKTEQNMIFSKFFRGSNSLKVNTEGVGIGLFIIKNIIELHGGKIWFESEEGRGTVFHIVLPQPKNIKVNV